MVAGRILQLDAEQWATAQEQAREGGGGTAVGAADKQTPDDPTRDDAAMPGATGDKVWPAAVLADEEANLQVVVEAWPTPDRPTTIWARLWSVVDGTLLDVRRRDGVVTPIERPAGSVAAELQWALVGAIDAVREVPTDLSSES